jgi:hypothetical protein
MAEESGRQASAGEAYASAKDVVKPQRGQTLQDARDAVQEARDAVRNVANAQKGKVASRLSGVAEALHETAKSLERQNASVGRYADIAAQQVDRVSQMLKERAVEQLVEDAEEFARTQPILFVGGALAAGFVFARVVRIGEPRSVRRTSRSVAEEAREAVGNTGAAATEAGERLGRTAAQSAPDVQVGGSPRPAAPGIEPYASGESSSGGMR